VLINLGAIHDAGFVETMKTEVASLRAEADRLRDQVVATVEASFG